MTSALPLRMNRRFAPLLPAVALGAMLCVLMVSSSAAAGPVQCDGTVKAGSRQGVQLVGFAIATAGPITCPRARRVIRAYFHAKLTDRRVRCAGLAVNPPFTVCRVGRFLCRATAVPERGSGVFPELCSYRRISVRFRERDGTTF